jgi:hypothetical protein
MARVKITLLVVVLMSCFTFRGFAEETADKVYDVYGRDIASEQLKDVPKKAGVVLQAAFSGTNGSAISFSPYQAFETGSWPEAVSIADLNSDGLNEVGITTSYYFDAQNDNRLHIFAQDSSHQLIFQNKYLTGGRPQSIDTGDLNGDGRIDIAVGNFGNNSLGVFTQNILGSLDPMVSYSALAGPDSLSIADLNNDRLSDVVVSHWNADSMGLFRQNIAGTLDPMLAYSVTRAGYDQIITGDINSDGLQDVVIMRGQGGSPRVVIFYQNAAGGFNSPVYLDYQQNVVSWGGISIGDINGDKKNDIVIVAGGNRPSSKLIYWLQGENGSLGLPGSYDAYDCPEAVKIADIDKDGLSEVIVAHGGWMNISVYKQNQGALDPYILFPIPYASHYQPQGLAVGDINGDEKPDIAIADYNYGLVVLYNTTNFPPILDPIGSKAVDEGQLLQFSLSAKDLDGDALSYSVSDLPVGASLDAVTGFFSWSPTYQQAGTYNVRFDVTDGSSSASEIVCITVNNVNLIPTAYIDSISPSPAQEGGWVAMEGHGMDTDGQITEYKWSSNIDGVLGSAMIVGLKSLSVGTHTISFKVMDNDGSWSNSVSQKLVVNKTETGAIYGTVLGRSKHFLKWFSFVPLPDATVTAVNIYTRVTTSVKTDTKGRYNMLRLSKGLYKVTASKGGYRPETRLENLKKGAQRRVDFRLF